MDSSKSKLLALLSFVLIVFVWFEFDWFNRNIYRHAPLIEVISPGLVDKIASGILGFFILSVGSAVLSGRLQFLKVPSRFLGKDYFSFLSHWLTVVVAACLGVVVFFIIVRNPAVHLDYPTGGEKPMVIFDGNPQHFNDNTIFLPIDPMELRNKDIEITGRHDLYRIKLDSSDTTNNRLLLSKHARIDLQKFFLQRNFHAELYDANNRRLDSIMFSYESTDSLSKQCAHPETGFTKYFSDGRCDGFFRELFKEIAGRPGRMLDDTEGSIYYERRKYDYRYNFDPTIKIRVTAPIAESKFGNKPLEAYDLYVNSNPHDRKVLVDEFHTHIEVISVADLGEIFKSLAVPESLYTQLNGTVAYRQATLSFIKDVLALGISHLSHARIQQLVEKIADTNLKRVHGMMPDEDSILLAIDTVMNLKPTVYALDRLEAFVRDLGTDSNRLKPCMAHILLRNIDDNTDFEEARRIVSIVGRLWRSAQGVDNVTNRIRTAVGDCLDRLANNELKKILRGFYALQNGNTDFRSPASGPITSLAKQELKAVSKI